MTTLRELAARMGLPGEPYDAPSPWVPATLRSMWDLAGPVAGDAHRGSLAALGPVLDGLPPLTLECRVDPLHGVQELWPRLHLERSPGLVLATRYVVRHSSGGVLESHNLGNETLDLPIGVVGVGTATVEIRRAGITSAGPSILTRTVQLRVDPRDVPPPPPPPPPQRPHLAASWSRREDLVVFSIDGTGFLPNQPVSPQGITVMFTDLPAWQMVHLGSDAAGAIRHSFEPVPLDGIPLNALGVRRVTVRATDSRKDPTSVPAGEPLWSNTVTLDLPRQ